jgi:chaperonin GroEL (HSP60 family)
VFNDGVGIIANVLVAHPSKIYGSTVFGKEMLKAGATVDYKTGKVKDALELGLLDSTKVQVSALENAISVASELMKTKRILTV